MKKRYNNFRSISTAGLLFILCAGMPAAAINDNAGISGAQVLKIGVGARALAMGGAFSAVCDDVTAIYHNPAGLARLDRMQVSFQHLVHIEDVQYANVSAAKPMGFGTLGVSVSHLWMGKIQGREDAASVVRGFDASDSVISVAYAKKMGLISAGMSLKMIYSKIDDADSTVSAVDAGAIADISENFSAAATVQNTGGQVKYKGDNAGMESDSLPRNFKLGLAYSIAGFKTAFDINLPNDNRANVNLGAEYVRDIGPLAIPLRLGYRTLNDFDAIDGISAGCGIIFKDISTDFAWVPFGELGDTIRVSLIFGF